MRKLLYTLLLGCFFLCFNSALQGGVKEFELIVPKNQIVANSLYDKLEFIDSRKFTGDLGFVQTSIFNNITTVKDRTPISEQIDNVMQMVLDSATAQSNTMLFQLRNLYFSEESKSTSETGYCHIRISLYEKRGKGYFHINTMDSLVKVKAMDVTGKLLKAASEAITSHFTKSLVESISDPVPYSLDDIKNIDLFEKDKLKLYTADELEDGVYSDFNSFANQTPVKADLIQNIRMDG